MPLEHIFGLCNTSKKITKQLGFHLTFKTADLQDIMFTTLANDILVKMDKLFLYVPILIPDAETQYLTIQLRKNPPHHSNLGVRIEKLLIPN